VTRWSSRSVFGLARHTVVGFAVAFGALIAGAVAYDAVIERVSTVAGAVLGIHTKCGPRGPYNPPRGRAKTFKLMARLSDGQLVSVQRAAGPMPDCGATIEIAERRTPWGTTWYSTRD
jgi:hypothetical protein